MLWSVGTLLLASLVVVFVVWLLIAEITHAQTGLISRTIFIVDPVRGRVMVINARAPNRSCSLGTMSSSVGPALLLRTLLRLRLDPSNASVVLAAPTTHLLLGLSVARIRIVIPTGRED